MGPISSNGTRDLVVRGVRRRALRLGGYLTRVWWVLRTVRAWGDTFPAILVGLEGGLAEFVALDCEFGSLPDGAGERPAVLEPEDQTVMMKVSGDTGC